MMDIRKLQKKLLKEELKRRRQKSAFWRWIVPGTLIALTLVLGALIYYLTKLDDVLEEDYAQAEIQLNQGNYQDALENFKAIHQRHPTFRLASQALYQSGEIEELYLKRYPEALLTYLLVQQEYPAEKELARKAQTRIAEIYKNRQRDYKRAVAEYRKLLDMSAQGADRVQYEIADTLFRLEAYQEAAVAFERLTASYPESPLLAEAHYRLGTVYSLLGNNGKAVETFRDLAANWPQSPYALEALFSLATALEEKDDLNQALAILQSLEGRYGNAEALTKKIEQVKNRKNKQRRG